MRAQYANATKSCNKYRQINYQLPNDVISRSITLPRVRALTRSVAESEMSLRSTGPHRKSLRTMRGPPTRGDAVEPGQKEAHVWFEQLLD